MITQRLKYIFLLCAIIQGIQYEFRSDVALSAYRKISGFFITATDFT